MNWNFFRQAILLVMAMSFSALLQADTVWIDVRSAVEHKIDHIEGDERISHGDIVSKVNSLYPDKNTEIRLYCRSGGRAGKALVALEADGYTDVKNAGSIQNARNERASLNNNCAIGELGPC